MKRDRRRGRLPALLSLLYAVVLLGMGWPGLQQAAPLSDPHAPPTATRTETRLTADRLIHRTIDGQPVTDLLGNVFIDRDTMSVRSDSARYWRDTEIYEFTGQVRARQHDVTLTCRHATYYRDAETADFYGDVRFEQLDYIGTAERGESRRAGQLLRLIGGARLVTSEYTVWADTIVRDRLTRQGEALGNVKIVDPASQTLVTGGHAVFAADGRSARVDVDPRLTSRDRGQELFEGRARVMHFYRDDQRMVMVDSVRIDQGRTAASADTALAYGQERLLLRGRPSVRIGEQTRMTGREIEFLYRDGQLSRIFLRGQAVMEDSSPDSLAALYTGLPPMGVLDGDNIQVELADNEVRRSVVIGNAHSLYVPTDLEDEVAYNEVNGDTIVINFRDEQVNQVMVNGNMRGTYKFARIAEMEPEAGTPKGDSLATTLPDTTEPASAPAESTLSTPPGAVRDSSSGPLDFLAHAETVDYTGQAVLFRLSRRTIEISREADLTYGTLNLTAAEVRFDTQKRELYASGDPLLEDQDQKITGDQMGYNFAHKSGAVRDGVTTFDGNFYQGKEIKRFEDGSLKILSGKMTSCDLEEPHYHFWSDKMKIKLKDKVVAKPVVLKIGRVPIIGLPFYFKSLKSGRRSGILFPSFNFGWSERTGRYIRDFGYYWATNDYTDFTFQGDYNENQDFNFRIRNQYVKRYGFRGNFAYSRLISLGDRPKQRQWQFQWSHNQDALFDEYQFRANVRMASSTLTRNDLGQNIDRDIVSGQLHSTAFISRNWSFMSASMNLTRDEQVNATDDDPTTDNQISTQVLPSLRLNFKRQSILRPLAAGKQGSFLGELLRATYYDHSYALSSSKVTREMTSTTTQSARGDFKLGVQPPRILIFNVSADAKGSQSWERKSTTGMRYGSVERLLYGFPNLTDLAVQSEGFYGVDETEESTDPALSFNSSLRTKLYGLLPVRLGRLRAIRHTLDLTAGYSLRPRLGSKQSRSESFNFALGNRFDVKYLGGSKRDSTDQERKLDGVLDWRLSTTYVPGAPSRQRWATIGSSISIKPGQSRNLSFKVGNSIDPYDWKILSTKLSYGLNMNGRLDTGGQIQTDEPQRSLAIDRLGVPADSTAATPAAVPEGMVPDEEPDPDQWDRDFAGYQRPQPRGEGRDPTEGGRYLPWNMSLSLSYNRNNQSNTSSARSNVTLSSSLSRHWEFSYQASIDLDGGTMLSQSYSLNRDLHCWRLEFRRSIYANDQVFGFRLYLKSIPAIKVTRGQEDELGGLGQFGGGIF